MGSKDFQILGIESLVYGVTDVPACERNLLDWGLEPIAGHPHRFQTAEATWIEVRPHTETTLPGLRHVSPVFDGSCAREVIWGVKDQASLAQIQAELARDRTVTASADGTLHTTDDAGNAIGFAVTRRVPVAQAPVPVNVIGAPMRVDRQADGAAKGLAAPALRINHFVYMATSPQEARSLADFYMQRLGFRLSDDIGGKGFFMRAGASKDHHNLLVECFGEGNCGVQHVAIEFRDLDHVMHRGTHLEAQGWQSHVGPGRHTLGSNLTWYFWSPLGGLMELVADMDQVTDNWQPRSIDPAKAGPPWAWLARPFPPGFRFGVGPR
jgi:hypothetical protein